MNEWTTQMSRGQGNDVHLQSAGWRFTCQPVTPIGDRTEDFIGGGTNPPTIHDAGEFETCTPGRSLRC